MWLQSFYNQEQVCNSDMVGWKCWERDESRTYGVWLFGVLLKVGVILCVMREACKVSPKILSCCQHLGSFFSTPPSFPSSHLGPRGGFQLTVQQLSQDDQILALIGALKFGDFRFWLGFFECGFQWLRVYGRARATCEDDTWGATNSQIPRGPSLRTTCAFC